MRRAAGSALVLGLLVTGCSGKAAPDTSSASRWKPGNAVVILQAEVKSATTTDYGTLLHVHGVISVSQTGGTLKVALSRQALLTDMAQVRLRMDSDAGLANVREIVVPP